jgi:N-acetylglucosamine kinase-like BadF-type ATPase
VTTPGGALYLGVDAGNSKTVAVLADGAGAVLGYGRGGRGDIYEAPTEAHAVAEVMTAIRQSLGLAGGNAPVERQITRAALCLAGLDWPSDESYWHEQLAHWLPGLGSYSLRNDGFALLRAGEPEGVGVALSAGTHAAIVARGPTGVEWSASFWIVDPVGGSALGWAAYAAVVRAELGVAPATLLTDVLLARLGFADVAALLEATTRRGGEKIHHAGLARGVLDAAAAGDPVALSIVDEQGRAFARYTVAAAARVGLTGPDISVVLGGSVLSSTNAALRDATLRALAELLPAARATLSQRSPVVGAVAEAIAEGEGSLRPDALQRLTGYEFPGEFLLT